MKTKTNARRVPASKKSTKRSGPKMSPRAMIRARFNQSGPEVAIKFGVKLPGMSEDTVKRYVAYFGSKAGKAEAAAAAKRAAKLAKKKAA